MEFFGSFHAHTPNFGGPSLIHGDFGQDAVLLPLEGVVSIGNFSAVVMQIIAMLKLEWGLEGCGRGNAKGSENARSIILAQSNQMWASQGILILFL